MKSIISLLTFFVLTGVSIVCSGQGCSDAGFCTVGNLKTTGEKVQHLHHSISLLSAIGIGDEDVLVITPGVEYKGSFGKNWSLQARVTVNYANGNLGSSFGAGDLFLAGTYLFNPEADWKISGTLGIKILLNKGNLKEDMLSLPMQYQSSLGTVDLITGISAEYNNFRLAAGWQQPMTGSNRNNFLPVYWNKPEAENYPPSNDFNRRGDVLLRADYGITGSEKWRFHGGLLGIYHVGKDTYVDANTSLNPIAIEGSEGLTLNLTALITYRINKKTIFSLSGGVPLVVRDVRPDGLTRKFVVAPELIFQF